MAYGFTAFKMCKLILCNLALSFSIALLKPSQNQDPFCKTYLELWDLAKGVIPLSNNQMNILMQFSTKQSLVCKNDYCVYLIIR